MANLVILSGIIACGEQGGGSGPDSPPPPPPPSPQVFTLTLKRADGLDGTPSTGPTTHTAGSVVPYSFSVQATHENLRVFIDGVVSPVAGNVLMDRDRVLTVVADRKIVVLPGVQGEVNAIANVYRGVADGSVRPMDAYRSVQPLFQAMRGKVPIDSIPRLLRVARLRSYPDADYSKVARAIQEISDSLAAAPSPPQGMRHAASPPDVVYLYVNGIRTDLVTAETTARDFLSDVVYQSGFGDTGRFSVQWFHNPDGNPDVRDFAALLCLQGVADAEREGMAPVPDVICSKWFIDAFGSSDLAEAYLQVVARALSNPAQTETSGRLSSRISELLASSRVVLVAHSQGNLMVDEAFRRLEGGVVRSRCVGTVSLAPPQPVRSLPSGYGANSRFVTGSNVKDALLLVEGLRSGTLPGIQSLPANQNSLSLYWNVRYAWWDTWLTPGAFAKRLEILFSGGKNLHGVDENYFGANRQFAIAALQEQTQYVLEGCATGLSFSGALADGSPGVALPAISVQVLGPGGSPAPEATVPVTLQLGANPAAAQLAGTTTVNAVNGIARFTNVVIDKAGVGFTLIASTPGAPSSTSPAFSVRISPPSAPPSLAATAVSSSRIDLSWADVSGELTYEVERCTGASCTNFAHLITLAAGTTSYQNTGLTAGTTYRYRVRATNAGGASGYAGPVAATTVEPVWADFATIAVGGYHSCGVTPSGAAACWGRNDRGQLGIGRYGEEWRPVLVAGTVDFIEVDGGESHTCGRATTGVTYCWGWNEDGQLGDGSLLNRTSPVVVVGGHDFVQVRAGVLHTCGLTRSSEVYCWGANADGQLGDGSTVARTTPTLVGGGHSFSRLAVGAYHNCALTAAGETYCWGFNNNWGQIGDGTLVNRTSPVRVAAGLRFVDIGAGVYHSCGLAAGGAVYCWGQNLNGQLGDGTGTDSRSPVQVTSPVSFSTLSVAGYYNCGISSTGSAYCWGLNYWGQLGVGVADNSRSVPNAVSGGLAFSRVSGMIYHTCGVTSGGATYCWGDGMYGQLGTGSQANQYNPARVPWP